MERRFLLVGVFCCLAFWQAAGPAGAAPKDKTAADAEAAALVTQALQAAVEGDLERRQSLLGKALEVAPDFAPAHWQLGHVRQQGVWRAAEEAGAAAAGDKRYADYRKLREAHGQSAAGQLLLARWCNKQGLADEERLHWQGVLFFDGRNQEAIKALGLHKFRNRWLTPDQIEQSKQFEQEVDKSREFWKPRLDRWAEAIERNLKSRNDALANLREVDDPHCIPWLEAFVSQRSAELGTIVVQVLGRFPQQEATDSLVRHAIGSELEPVRAAAIEALQARPLQAFAGRLVESLTAPPELKIHWNYVPISALSQSSVSQQIRLEVEGMNGVHALDDDIFLLGRLDVTGNRGYQRLEVSGDDYAPQAHALAAKRQAVANQAARLEQRNIRICEALQAVTGQEFGRDEKQWWKWWLDYNEQYVPSAPKPVHRVKSSFVDVQPATYQMISCFTGDTLVQTKLGALAISTIKAGDYVLAQDVDSGELAYKLVLGTTIRPAHKLRQLRLGEEELVCTLGHPLWVVGRGWRMAKELQPGDRLQRLGGEATVTSVDDLDQEASAYNLIVADFANYFVGHSAILAHDNTSRKPTLATVPGLQAQE
jgi:hypothetical protein